MQNKDYYWQQFRNKDVNRFYIYLHRRLSDNKVFYVGKGNRDRAWSLHGRNKRWHSIVNKHGYSIEIVFDDLSENDAFDIEIDVIKEMRYFYQSYLCNVTDGGDGTSGMKQSAETIAKRVLKNKGKKRTEESKRRISDALKGKKISEAAIEKSRVSRTGMKRSEEAVRKTAESNRGKKRNEETKLKMKASAKANADRTNLSEQMKGINNRSADKTVYEFMNVHTGDIFVGTRISLCEKYNLNRYTISNLFNASKRDCAVGWSLLKE